MPTSDHVARLPPTTERVHLLLDLTIAGFTHRIADEFLDVTHEDGTTLTYGEGLDVDFETAASFFTDSLGEAAVPISVVLPNVDVAALVAAGHDLTAGTATLARWVEGTTLGQRQILLSGVVTSPTFGAEGEPLSFSLATLPIADAGLFPPSSAVIDLATWEHAPEASVGRTAPFVFGCPGWWDVPDGGRVAGTPVICLNERSDLWMVANHPVQASSVWIRNFGDPNDTWQLVSVSGSANAQVSDLGYAFDGSVELDVWASWAPLPGGWILTPGGANLVDGETFDLSDGTTTITFEFNSGGGVGGGNVAIAFTGASTATEVGEAIVDAVNAQDWTIRALRGPNTSQYRIVLINTTPGTAGNVTITNTVASGLFTHFGMSGGLDEDERGGIVGPDGNAMRGAGDLLEYMLSRSTLDVDRGAFRSLRSRLNAYRISGYIDEPVVPWEWVRAHLMDLLPISLTTGPDGLQPVLWRYAPGETDEVARFDVDLLEAERVGLVEYGDPGDVANVFTLKWALRADEDEYVETATLDGREPGATFGARTSVSRHGARERVIESDLVYDAATAGRVLGWMSYAYGAVALHVSYEVPRANAIHLAVGDVVSVSDNELHFDGKLFHVASIRDDGSGSLEVALRSLEEPSR